MNRVKKDVCIFNCLGTRAVHLEIIPSLDVDGFLQADVGPAAAGMFVKRKFIVIMVENLWQRPRSYIVLPGTSIHLEPPTKAGFMKYFLEDLLFDCGRGNPWRVRPAYLYGRD